MLKVNHRKLKTHKNVDLNVAFISDIHYDFSFCPILENKIIYKIKDMNPNYICITGDIIDGVYVFNNNEVIKKLVSFLGRLSKVAKVFIVLGSHDLETVSSPDNNFEKYIVKWKEILNDENNIFLLDNQRYEDKLVNIIGLTLPFNYYHNAPSENVDIIIKQLNDRNYEIDNNKYNLLLIHSPRRILTKKALENIDVLKKIDLVLCGHMHDGVVPKFLKKLPTTIGFISPQKTLFPRYARGKCTKKISNHKITLLVTGGITKISPALPKYIKMFKPLYNNEIEYIEVRKNDK